MTDQLAMCACRGTIDNYFCLRHKPLRSPLCAHCQLAARAEEEITHLKADLKTANDLLRREQRQHDIRAQDDSAGTITTCPCSWCVAISAHLNQQPDRNKSGLPTVMTDWRGTSSVDARDVLVYRKHQQAGTVQVGRTEKDEFNEV